MKRPFEDSGEQQRFHQSLKKILTVSHQEMQRRLEEEKKAKEAKDDPSLRRKD
jgi:hypothetical protein